jgi:hypothetical protein
MVKNFFSVAIPLTVMLSVMTGFLFLNGMFWGGML